MLARQGVEDLITRSPPERLLPVIPQVSGSRGWSFGRALMEVPHPALCRCLVQQLSAVPTTTSHTEGGCPKHTALHL